MSQDSLKKFAVGLVNSFLSGQVTPKALLDDLWAHAADNDLGVRQAIDAAWAAGNKSRQSEGKPAVDPSHPLIFSRGWADSVAEDELKHFLPEEKILINQGIFRSKLANVDFANLDATKERTLIEELRNESIGLTRENALLYFNLIKVDFLSRKGGASPQVPPETAAQSAEKILRAVEVQFFLDKEALAKMNSGRVIDPELLLQAVKSGVDSQRYNPKILQHFLGLQTTKYVDKFKEFLRLVVDQRDGNLNEVLQNFGIYLLLNGTSADLIAKLQLSSPLEAFVTDKIGRVRQIYYVAILFAYSLMYVLFAQVYEIAAKYQQMPEDQKGKLRKLYEADDRLGMLVTNATNVATRRVANYGVEVREIQLVLKKFLAANKRLVVAGDLFSTRYDNP